MAEAKQGDKVKIHYTGKLDDGSVFDSSLEREPLEFTLGSGEVIEGFDTGVVGMNEGEEKTVTIPCDKAYGERDDRLIQKVPRAAIPEEITLEEGIVLAVRDQSGSPMQVTVTEFNDSEVTLDANFPLAGKDLTFDLKLVEICK